MGNDDLASPDHDRSGPTVDDAVDTAEQGSQVEGVHTPSGQEASGQSRVEQMPEVDGADGPRADGDPDASGSPGRPGPGPGEIGAGGAQRIEGARVSDRVAAGEPVPDTDPDPDT
jgi:hypothetical protein